MSTPKRLSINEQKYLNRLSNSKYFEAILQLRNITEEQFEEIADQLKLHEVRIAKIVEHDNGLDLLISSQKFIQQLEKWIKSRYTCHTEMSRTLHTRDTQENKDLYRLTLFVNFLKFNIGDVVEYRGEQVKLTSLGKKPSGKVLGSGKRIFLDPEALEAK